MIKFIKLRFFHKGYIKAYSDMEGHRLAQSILIFKLYPWV